MRGVAGEPLRSAAEAGGGKATARVAFVSDRWLVAEGLRRLVGSGAHAGSVVVVRPEEAIGARIDELDPRVTVIEGRIEGAADLVRTLAAPEEGRGVVVIGDTSVARALDLLSAGALAYLDGEATTAEFEQALAAAARGEGSAPPRLAAELLQRTLMESRWSGPGQPLTRREAEVARLLRAGQSNKQTARRLQIEVSTVTNHVHSILVKLGLHGRGDIVRWRSDSEPSLSRRVNGI